MANDINDSNQNNDEDNFGLPDIEYKPLDQLEQKPTEQESVNTESEQTEYTSNETVEENTYETRKYSDSTRSYEEEEKSNAPVIIGIIVAIVVIVGAFLVWQFVYQPRKKAQEQKELLAKQEAAKKAEAARLAKEEEERKRKEAEAAAAANAKPAEGSIETLSARTGRYYVIVSSAVDGDLVMDNAKKMSAKGVSTKIIPPFGKWKFYRLAIADFDSFAGAQSNADASKGEYGPATWVMRY